MSSVPHGVRTLVLNDDYVPLNIVHWKRGIKRLFESHCINCGGRGFKIEQGKHAICMYCNGTGILPPANAVEYYDYWIRDSKGCEHPVPAVVANSHHVTRPMKKIKFSRQNVFKRDNFTCQYCGAQLSPAMLTMDHVVPRSMWRGCDTPTSWKNIVAACFECNRKKANKTPEQAGMQLRKMVGDKVIPYKYPKVPNYQEMVLGLNTRQIPPEWQPYVQHFIKQPA